MKTESTIAWYNENEGRAYPVSETVTRISDDGKMLPNDIVVDIGILVPPEHSDIYISSIRATDTIVSLGLRSILSGLMVGVGIFARSTLRPYTAYPLTPVVDNVSGWVVFGTHNTRGMIEDYRFSTYSQSGLEKRTVTVIDSLPVRRFLRLTGCGTEFVDRIVKLRAGSNILIEADVPNNKIIIKLAPGTESAFVGPCKNKASEAECSVPPIRRINGVCADEFGTINLRFE
jgi:hypothetical protein